MNAVRKILADTSSYGEPDAADMLALRRNADRTDNAMLADAMARSLKTAIERASRPLARIARRFVEERSWIRFGFARLEDHARERFGRSARWVRDLAALDRAVERLPRLAAALAGNDGKRPVGRVAAMFIGQVASPESSTVWIEMARSLTVRELKDEVRRARRNGSAWPGDEEDDETHTSGGVLGAEPTKPGDGDDESCRLRVVVPLPVRTAFDEAAGLHRAVSGAETSTTSFVEALVAEACAGAHPPDVEFAVPTNGVPTAETERRLAVSTNRWERLERTAPAFPALPAAESCLRRLSELTRLAGQGSPHELDQQLRDLINVEDEMEKALARLLLEMTEQRAWKVLGFTGVGQYAEERLGLSRSSATDRVRLARALRGLGGLCAAYDAGALTTEAARLVVSALGSGQVSPEVEQRWIERAERATVKRLRDELREWRRRRSPGVGLVTCEPLDDAEWHASLRQAPGVFRDRVRTLGRLAVQSPSADARLNLTLPADLAGRFLAAVEASREAAGVAVARESQGPGSVDGGDSPSLEAARAFSTSRVPIPAWIGLLSMLEDFVETWDDPQAHPKRRSDAVYVRDGWRCAAPACTSRCNLEDHHIRYRSRGGGDELSNRTCLCRFHHQQGEHGTLASCEGVAPLGITWRIGLPRVTWYRNELRIGGELVRESSRFSPEEHARFTIRVTHEPVRPASVPPG
jgi:hypothetical protein